MKATERALVTARRDKAARRKMLKKHVEFCSDCGRACDRTGRRDSSRCIDCERRRKEDA